jgi:uncharacterized DUF497 family protein
VREVLDECDGFDWDQGNLEKNWERHRVAWWECEQVLLNEPLLLTKDPSHSVQERRYVALGKTHGGRRLFVALTIRRRRIRVISARDMSRRERRIFGAHEEENPEVQE